MPISGSSQTMSAIGQQDLVAALDPGAGAGNGRREHQPCLSCDSMRTMKSVMKTSMMAKSTTAMAAP